MLHAPTVSRMQELSPFPHVTQSHVASHSLSANQLLFPCHTEKLGCSYLLECWEDYSHDVCCVLVLCACSHGHRLQVSTLPRNQYYNTRRRESPVGVSRRSQTSHKTAYVCSHTGRLARPTVYGSSPYGCMVGPWSDVFSAHAVICSEPTTSRCRTSPGHPQPDASCSTTRT